MLVASLVTFERDARSAVQQPPVLCAVRREPGAVDAGAFADALVTSAERGDTYSPVVRFLELVGEAETPHGFDIAAVHLSHRQWGV